MYLEGFPIWEGWKLILKNDNNHLDYILSIFQVKCKNASLKAWFKVEEIYGLDFANAFNSSLV